MGGGGGERKKGRKEIEDPNPSSQCYILDSFRRTQASPGPPTQPVFPVVREIPFRALEVSPERMARLKQMEIWKSHLRHVFQHSA